MRLAIDTGGTFTDVVLEDDQGALTLHKAPTTPEDPVAGVLEAIRRAADSVGLAEDELLRRVSLLVHGTTRATNAVLTGRTARTAFLTTSGHREILLFRIGGRENPFDHAREYPRPYVPRRLTFEVEERVDYRGEVIRPLDVAGVERTARQLVELGVEAAGVCLLWSIVNPDHELAVGEVLAREAPGIAVTLSHRINPVIREYHRASAACIDASLKPLMSTYLAELRSRLHGAGFGGRLLVSGAAGGLLEPEWLARAPIHSINSGPAMAPVAGRHHAEREAGGADAIVVDTGGTSFDVSLVRQGRIPRTRETWLGHRFVGHLTGFPAVDVRTTGAGGGSIAKVDAGGLLTVGPDSAGSVPGPVCYGRGGSEVTVTDACLVLGYLEPDRLRRLGIDVDAEAAHRAVEALVGEPLGLDRFRAAEAIMRVLTETMVHAIEEVTVEQGVDPREAVLVAGGGAAGFNIVSVAARLGCRRVVIPQTCAGLSATGGLISDVVAEESAAVFTTARRFDAAGVGGALRGLRERCAERMRAQGLDPAEAELELTVEARYAGQVWELEVPLPPDWTGEGSGVADVVAGFHRLHEEIFAVRDERSDVEMVGWHARLRLPLGTGGGLDLAVESELPDEGERSIYVTRAGWCTVPVYGSARIRSVTGPAVLELPGTSIVLDHGAVATRGTSGSILVVPQGATADVESEEAVDVA